MDQFKLFLESVWADQRILAGLVLAVALGGYFWYLGPAVPERYSNCPRGSIIFENPAFGYYACIPGDWAGKFEPKSQDRRSFMVYTGDESRPEIFSIWSVPELRWDDLQRKENLTELARGNGRVFSLVSEKKEESANLASFDSGIEFIKEHFSVLDIDTIEEAVSDYVENIFWPVQNNEGKMFSQVNILGSGLKDDGGFRYYTWTYAQGYDVKDGVLREVGGELNVPVGYAIGRDATDAHYVVQVHRVPRGGLDFVSDVQDIFPENILPPTSEWFAADRKFLNDRVAELKLTVRAKARSHFKVSSEKFEGFIRRVRRSGENIELEIGRPSETEKEQRTTYSLAPTGVVQMIPKNPILNQEYEVLDAKEFTKLFQENSKTWSLKKVKILSEGKNIVHIQEL